MKNIIVDDNYFLGYDTAYLYILSKGCKKVANLSKMFVKEENCIAYIENLKLICDDFLNSGLAVHFIPFKFSTNNLYSIVAYCDGNQKSALKIIKILQSNERTAKNHVDMGKIFGYSDEAIKKFLNHIKST